MAGNNTTNLKDFGNGGAEVFADAISRTGKWYAVYAVTDMVIEGFTGNVTRGNALWGQTLVAGTILYIQVTQFQLTSGIALLYKGK